MSQAEGPRVRLRAWPRAGRRDDRLDGLLAVRHQSHDRVLGDDGSDGPGMSS